ncbi:MAG: zinc ribbon domain-containing protein [Candidatus Heimdallarchaeota archaeon]|nr:zinc ribbon domain-containing protein [Candidatus Heimdallarchaeota archaeon]
MAYCTNCSRQIKATAKFCIYCGARRQVQSTQTQSTPRQSYSKPTQQIQPQKVVPKQNTPKTITPRQNVPHQNIPKRNVPQKQVQQSRHVDTSQRVSSQHKTKTKASVQTKREVPSRTSFNEEGFMDRDLYQLNQRLSTRLDVIKRSVQNFERMLDGSADFSRSDATLLYQYRAELKDFSKNDAYKNSDYRHETNSLIDKIKFISIDIFESLTHDVNEQSLIEMREEWKTYRDTIEKKMKTKELLDALERQNKIINKKIDDLERIFGSPSYEAIYKSQLFTRYKSLRDFYIKELGPAIESYLSLIEDASKTKYADYFGDEKKMLRQIKTYIDPNVSNRAATSTREISKKCFDFLEERGVNASTLRLQLAELEEELSIHQDEIVTIEKDYTRKMWDLINSEKLAISGVDYQKPKSLKITTYQPLRSNPYTLNKAKSMAPAGDLHPLHSLNKLKPLKHLDDFEN